MSLKRLQPINLRDDENYLMLVVNDDSGTEHLFMGDGKGVFKKIESEFMPLKEYQKNQKEEWDNATATKEDYLKWIRDVEGDGWTAISVFTSK